MEHERETFSLTEPQLNLRLGLVNLIRDHVERGMNKEDLAQVLESLDLVFGDLRFQPTEFNLTNLNKSFLEGK